MKLLILSERDLWTALPMHAAIRAMKDAFTALSTKEAVAPQRMALPIEKEAATSLLMGAYVPSMGLAAKVVSVFPRNPARGKALVNGLVLVLDPTSGEPEALIDGTALTAWRTGAASGAATDLLARKDASVAALIGCGVQARTQLLAIAAVRKLSQVRVHARTPERVRAFCEAMQPHVSAKLVVAPTAESAVRGAHIICTATPAHAPVFDGTHVADGAHVNAVGSFTLDMCELDTRTIERATIFVDEVEAALTEAGELVIAEAAGVTRRDRWTELGLVANGSAPGRTRVDEITLFKSVGHAVQDVAAASRALAAARELGLGTEVCLNASD